MATMLTEKFSFDGGRGVTVRIPDADPALVVLAADGQRIARWGDLLGEDDLPATMIVGIHGKTDETERLHEYSPGFDPGRFAAHERFFVDETRQWVEQRFGLQLTPERTAVFGASAGGELALALGLRHPDVFGTILAGSPGAGYRPDGSESMPLPRTYLVAGTDEPFFLENATRWADALRTAGAEVVLEERPGDHGDALWRAEFPLMIRWAAQG